MKRVILIFSFLNLAIWTYGQQPMVKGRLFGPDSLSIPGVAVVMQTIDSVYLNAGVSNADGYFSIESSIRPYRLLIQHIAYKPLTIESSKDDVGAIRLEESVNELKGITVKATRPIMKVDKGKLAYDLGAISEGKLIDNAFDLVKELPSISSESGGISIIGNMGGTDILISGKKSNMSTDQTIEYLRTLPTSQVETIEVVYNPPASWHVKGSAINIVLKKENKYALQGQVQGRYTNQYANSYMAGGSLFLSLPNLSFDLIYNFNDNRNKYRNIQKSLHTLDSETYDIQTNMLTRGHHQYHNIYGSLKYDFTNKSNLDLSYVGRFAPDNDSRSTNLGNYFPDACSEENKDDNLHDISLTYTSKFGLKTGAEYTRFRNNGLQMMQYLEGTQITTDVRAYDMRQQINRANAFADMNHSLPKGWQLSYGAKYDYTHNKNTQIYDDRKNEGAGNYTNSSEMKEHVTNAYVGLGKSFLSGKLNVNASVTGEWYKINEYKKNVVLPNVSLSYMLSPKHSFQMGYRTFRVYPSYWARQEYTTYEDDYNVAEGNPELRPAKYSFINLMYILRSKYMFQVSYYKVDDFFTQQDYQSSQALQKIRKTVNLDFCSLFQLMAVIPVKIGEIWSVNLIGNLVNERYKADQWFDLSYDRNKWAGFFSANNSVTLLKKPMVTFNASIAYKTPYIQGIWDMDAIWNVNAGIKWEIIKNKAVLNFQCTDIFNTGYPMIKTRYANQHLDMDYTAYQRSFMVSFSYSFKGYKEKRTRQVDTSRYGM